MAVNSFNSMQVFSLYTQNEVGENRREKFP